MGEEEPNESFMDTWLDSPYIYDIYGTNDGDSMTVMTQVRSEGWNMTYITCQAWIEHLRGRSWELEKAKRLLLEFGGRCKRKREATWQSMSNHTNLTWLGLMDDLGKIRRIRMFIKYRNKPRECIFIIWWIWVGEERASGWLVPCLANFKGEKFPS